MLSNQIWRRFWIFVGKIFRGRVSSNEVTVSARVNLHKNPGKNKCRSCEKAWRKRLFVRNVAWMFVDVTWVIRFFLHFYRFCLIKFWRMTFVSMTNLLPSNICTLKMSKLWMWYLNLSTTNGRNGIKCRFLFLLQLISLFDAAFITYFRLDVSKSLYDLTAAFSTDSQVDTLRTIVTTLKRSQELTDDQVGILELALIEAEYNIAWNQKRLNELLGRMRKLPQLNSARATSAGLVLISLLTVTSVLSSRYLH